MFPPLLVLLLISASAASRNFLSSSTGLQPWGGSESISKALPSHKAIAPAARTARAGRKLHSFGVGFGSLPPREPPLVLPMRFADHTIAAAAALRPLGRLVVEPGAKTIAAVAALRPLGRLVVEPGAKTIAAAAALRPLDRPAVEPRANTVAAIAALETLDRPVAEFEEPLNDNVMPLLPQLPDTLDASVPPLGLTRKVQALLVLLVFAFALSTQMSIEAVPVRAAAWPDHGFLHASEQEGGAAVHYPHLLPEDEQKPPRLEAEQDPLIEESDSDGDVAAKTKKGYSRMKA